MSKGKPRCVLKVPKAYEQIASGGLYLDANVLIHGFPGGIRHEPIDIPTVLRRHGFQVCDNDIYKEVDGGFYGYNGRTLSESLKQARADFPELTELYRVTTRDAIGEVEDYVDAMGYKRTASEYLFGGDVPDAEVGTRLEVSRVYRSAMGIPLDNLTKWSQTDRWGDGYVAFLFDVDVGDADVYHPGAGGWFGQSVRGIKTSGKIRCTDPLRDGRRIEWNPKEGICISDCCYGDETGGKNWHHFYPYYGHWRDLGKRVWFTADMVHPPDFPCKIVRVDNRDTRVHNVVFVGYTGPEVTDIIPPEEWEEMRKNMSKRNVDRNLVTKSGKINWPVYDEERVEELLFGEMNYNFQVPKKIDLIKRVTDKARFPITKKMFRDRALCNRPASTFNGIAASIVIFLFEKTKKYCDEDVKIDLLSYPYFSNHQFVDEALWGFEECAAKLGLTRNGTMLKGLLTNENKRIFRLLIEKTVSKH